jgi:S-(hydroxymethyl)glutathione dehydrogenase/alcohol dehydrogenase
MPTRWTAWIRGLFPAILGHEGAGIVREVGAGVTSVKPGDHVIPLYTPECRQCKTCLSRRSNLCTSIRATQGKGVMPDGTSRFRASRARGGNQVFHYMGCSTFANFTVLPEIAVAKVREDAPFDKICYIGCGVTTGIGAVIYTRRSGRAPTSWCSASAASGSTSSRARAWSAPTGSSAWTSTREAGDGAQVRHDPLRQPEGGRQRQGRAGAGGPDGGGADFSFDCTGNVNVMRQALECCHRGWGESIIIGVAEAGGDRDAALPARHRPGLEGQRLRRARGRTDVPKIVDWYMEGKINIDDLITHTMPLDASTRPST